MSRIGKPSLIAFSSCRHATSGASRSSHRSKCASRDLMPLTLKVATFMAARCYRRLVAQRVRHVVGTDGAGIVDEFVVDVVGGLRHVLAAHPADRLLGGESLRAPHALEQRIEVFELVDRGHVRLHVRWIGRLEPGARGAFASWPGRSTQCRYAPA